MHIQSKIQKWGNGLAIRISGALREVPHFEEGTPIDIEVSEQGLLIKKADQPQTLPFSEAQLLKGLNAHTVHADDMPNMLPGEFEG